MPQCAVATCRNSHRKTKGRRVRYHRFPAEADVRRRWVEACGRRQANTTNGASFNTATARVCSLHFSTTSYERDVEHELLGLPPRSRLKRGAVPDRGVPCPTPSLIARKKQQQQQQQVSGGRQRRRAVARRANNHDAAVVGEEEEERCDVTGWGGGIAVLLALGLTPAAKTQDGGDHGLNRMHVMDDDAGKATTPAPEDLAGEGAPKRCREPPPAADKENTAPEEDKPPPTAPAAVDGSSRASSPQAATQPDKEEAVAPEKKEKDEPAGECEKTEAPSQPDVKENGEVETGDKKPPSPTPPSADPERKCTVDVKTQSEPSPPPSPGDDDDRSSAGKRASSDSDSDTPAALKKVKLSKAELEERDRAVSEYVESAAGTSLDELQRCATKLQQEISTLEAMARAKEHEWNNILRLKKVKEEMYLRLQRKRQVMLLMMGGKPGETMDWDPTCGEFGVLEDLRVGRGRTSEAAVNLTKSSGKQGRSQQVPGGSAGVSLLKSGQHLMMVPIVSSTPSSMSRSVTITSSSSSSNPQGKIADSVKERRSQRPILPKPAIMMPGGANGQNPVIGEGRQGTILDVRSIIADYRSRHPEMVPRRGRRLKSSLSPTPNQQLQPSPEGLVSSTRVSGSSTSGGVFSMASLALGSGSQMRAGPADLADLGFLTAGDVSRQDASSRPSSADSSRSGAPPHEPGGGFSFKDVLVQFAKLSQAEQGHSSVVSGKPAPPYPEVTLHPVLATQHSPPHPSPSSSLLHGILTKSAQRPAPEKPTTFSPTLARLLTAPERMPGNVVTAMPTTTFHNVGHVSINDLLSSSKGRSEVTITPVTTHTPVKTKEEVVMLEEDEQEDSVDRLVIDESGEADGRGRSVDDAAGDGATDEVPECQGCHRRAAQFVCAGCGNQWYCSRDCQVSAWDEHSEVCSG